MRKAGPPALLPSGWNSNLTANLTAGALYYARMMDHYNIPETQTAAAYNGGPYGYMNAQGYQQVFNERESALSKLVNCVRGF